MTLHLYAAATSNAQRAACMLEELGLPYTLHKVDLAKGAQKTPEFLAINPAGQVPALVDDAAGVTLAQSIAILLYLAEKNRQAAAHRRQNPCCGPVVDRLCGL